MGQLITPPTSSPGHSACQVQDKQFSQFTWNSAAVSPNSVAIAGDTDPNYPGGANVNIGIGFDGPFGIGPGAASTDINISYRVDVTDPNYLIDDASLVLGGVNFNGGTGSLSGSEDWCANGDVLTGCVGGELKHADILFSATSGTGTYHVTFSSDATFVTVHKDIQVNSDPTVRTDFSSIDQTFSQTNQSLPEPATLTLFGSALLGLGILGRKRFAR